MTLLLLPEPLSPRQRRTLKGESIRSLRGSFQQSLTNPSTTSSLLLPTTSPSASSENDDVFINIHEEKRADEDTEVVSKGDDDNDDIFNSSSSNSSRKPPSPSSAVSLTSRRPAHEVRMEFLQNLGIQKQPDPAATDNNTNSTGAAIGTTFEPWGPSYEGFINDDGRQYDKKNKKKNSAHSSFPLQREEEEEDENRRQRHHNIVHVEFDNKIIIHPIPSHKVYSNRIKQTIWTGAEELNDNVARNSLEFSYEDWNAANVVDEDSGLIWYTYNSTSSSSSSNSPHHGVVGGTPSGEWVHPVHFLDLQQQQQSRPNTGAEQQPQKQQQQLPSPCSKVEETSSSSLSSDEVWRQQCERLGIQPAEYYHSLSSSPSSSTAAVVPPPPLSTSDASTTTTTTTE
jgi:hypothetical protein